MNLSFSIRHALLTEHESLCALFEELDEHHRLARPDVFRKPLGPRREASLLDQLIIGPDSVILVAEADKESLLGLAVLMINTVPVSIVCDARRFVYLESLIVRSDARRVGIGQSLIAASKAWAQTQNISSLEVAAWSFNSEAITFYRKVGFLPTIERFAMPVE